MTADDRTAHDKRTGAHGQCETGLCRATDYRSEPDDSTIPTHPYRHDPDGTCTSCGRMPNAPRGSLGAMHPTIDPEPYQDLYAVADHLRLWLPAHAYTVELENTGGGILCLFVGMTTARPALDDDAEGIAGRYVVLSDDWNAGLYRDWDDPDDIADGRLYSWPGPEMLSGDEACAVANWTLPLVYGWLAPGLRAYDY